MISDRKKKDILKAISKETGMSVSSIYKILSNPFQFSQQSISEVRKVAEKYGFTVSSDASATDTCREGGASIRHILRIAIVVPSRPLQFWREAVMGFEKAREQIELEQDIFIKFVYGYHHFPGNEADTDRLFAHLKDQTLDGCILYPICGEICRDFVEHMSSRAPLVIFNDLQDYMTDAWFAERPGVCFIGTDNYDEGYKAASIAISRKRQMRRLAAVHIANDSGCQSSRIRVRGFCDGMQAFAPGANVVCIDEIASKRATASILARKLELLFESEGQEPDCVYFANGGTYIACSAIEKLARRHKAASRTVAIGHELLDGDKRYLMEGRQCGYIKQDVYTQGFDAVQDIVACIQSRRPLETRKYSSSVYIR